MRINYNRLLDLNKEAMGIDREMACYWVIQGGVERIVNGETLVPEQKNLLIEMGVLELTEEEEASKSIVGPFKFNNDGIKETH
jgi:hypothetical protein